MQKPILETLIVCVVLFGILLGDAKAQNEGLAEIYGVGFSRAATVDPMGGRMQYSIWYPTRSRNGVINLGPLEFRGTRDAEPADGQFGLVVLSHGHAGSDLGHRNIAMALAEAGIVAVAPLHPRDNFRDVGDVTRPVVLEGRPRQISAVIDDMLNSSKWASVIDRAKIGAFGFSMGGYTVISLLGAKAEMNTVVEHCKSNSNEDPMCRRAGPQLAAMPLVGNPDSRLCAAVLADPVSVMFPESELAKISNKQIQIYLPEYENELAAEFHGERVFKYLSGNGNNQVERFVVSNAQHFSFLAPFPEVVAREIPELANDPQGFDRAVFQKQFAEDVTGFFVKAFPACRR